MRRSRYTLTVRNADGSTRREVVLGYTPQGLVTWANQYQGWHVVSVVKGDYRCTVSGHGWKALTANLAAAKDFLGLTLPVRIKQTGHKGGRYGAYSLRIDPRTGRPYHHITVKNWLVPSEAGRTLWHELCHAMQAERAALAAGAVRPFEWLEAWQTTDERAGSYKRRAIEVEARSYEDYNAEQPLAAAR